jgi:hypothetical protein
VLTVTRRGIPGHAEQSEKREQQNVAHFRHSSPFTVCLNQPAAESRREIKRLAKFSRIELAY